jgi:uncharacterized protein YukE
MDYATATDPVVLAELQAVQGILAGVTVALDEAERNMPPMACTWQGSARQSYARNLEQLLTQVTTLVTSIADARAAVASAISAA